MNRNKPKPKRSRNQDSILAKNLRRLMQERGISTRVAAQMAGTPQSTIQDWLSGASPSDLNKVYKLAQSLGVSFSYLCLGIHESPVFDELPLSALFDEQPAFDGVFRISATRLIQKKKNQGVL